MTRSRSFTLKVIGVLGVVLLYGGLLTSAFAEHGTRTIDANPESGEAVINTTTFITISLSSPAASDIEQPIEIDGEMESYSSGTPPASTDSPNDPDPANNEARNSYNVPDFTCMIPAGAQSCQVSYKGTTVGTDQIRFWVDHDHSNSTFGEQDETEQQSGDSNQTTAGQGDICNSPGPTDSSPPSGEPDCTDVVQVNWRAADRQAVTLDCDDETSPDRETETNAAGQSETYTCKLRNASNQRGPRGTVYGEVENGVNDPDATDGASYDSPDYQCAVATSGDSESDCTITVTQNENEAGTAEICFWVFGQGSSEDSGAELCATEPTNENQQANGADVGNDLADQVELTWSAAGTGTTNTATTSGATTSRATTSTTTTARTTGGMTTPPGQSTTTSTTSTPADERVATTLTIKYRRGAFKGAVGSSEDRCKGSRLITVKKVRRGPDATVGKTRSKSSGAWSLRKRARRGRYYAVASTKVFTESDGHRVICQRAKSRTIRR